MKTEVILTVTNEIGLHARPCALLVKTASKFESKITIQNIKSKKSSSAKSIMGLLTLDVNYGSKIKIVADGKDAREALEEIKRLAKNKFEEKQPPKEIHYVI